MQKLNFSNSSVAQMFCDSQTVKGSIQENSDGTATLSYARIGQPERAVESSDEQVARAMEHVARNFSWINQRIDRLWSAHYEHTHRHLPNPATPSQMQTAVNALGLGDDYVVQKRTIYASHGDSSLELSY